MPGHAPNPTVLILVQLEHPAPSISIGIDYRPHMQTGIRLIEIIPEQRLVGFTERIGNLHFHRIGIPSRIERRRNPDLEIVFRVSIKIDRLLKRIRMSLPCLDDGIVAFHHRDSPIQLVSILAEGNREFPVVPDLDYHVADIQFRPALRGDK